MLLEATLKTRPINLPNSEKKREIILEITIPSHLSKLNENVSNADTQHGRLMVFVREGFDIYKEDIINSDLEIAVRRLSDMVSAARDRVADRDTDEKVTKFEKIIGDADEMIKELYEILAEA